mmetsp:Transcript_36354/g.102697  ORF Transcript_36354/g.102697 Transcript_36354/m.102697 type:complete len:309 (+) Transcript_36354:165-1091(+)|eukprot:CAMPEP_0117678378 /NCGR_PEP_ID=MMETSP0804-20121206/17264_1 /TAXON_ID=1074897 /ORGANISM="Tetraselmis astigmatica, Strain CCMP880" /LENGTH=308 /DNA_ID=CAMNT_0005487759 /DNA_START=101 /DNA_END=1027 /DNA_ORIENTATION=+
MADPPNPAGDTSLPGEEAHQESREKENKPSAWRPVTWSHVFGHQPLLLACLLIVLVLLPSQIFLLFAPGRDFYYSQPTATYPGESLLTRPHMDETVPAWLLGVLTSVLILLLAALELLLAPRYHRNATSAYHSALLLLLDAIMVNIIVYAMVSFTKQSVGRPRPDFFARLASNDIHGITDGRWSYPSGHAATSMACGTFWALHLTWTFFFRPTVGKFKKLATPQWQADLWSFLEVVVIGIGPVLALFIATSRIYDYRHNPSDVNAGALFGIVGTCFWWARSMGQRGCAQVASTAAVDGQTPALHSQYC